MVILKYGHHLHINQKTIMKYITLIFCSLLANIAVSQSLLEIKGGISDKHNIPIANVNISLEGTTIGTISNNKGDFNLKIPLKFCKGKLTISHIEYQPATIELFCKDDDKINIKLQDKIVHLEEVIITSLTAYQIVYNAIMNLEKNFQLDSINYTMFSRYTETLHDSPILLEESVYNLYHENNSKPEFNLIKIRGEGFSKIGKKRFEEARLIGIHSTENHIMLRYLPNFLMKKKMKKWTYQIQDEIEIEDDMYYVIQANPNNSRSYLKEGEIYINKINFAITYLQRVYKGEDYFDACNSYYIKSDSRWVFTHGSISGWRYYKKENITIKRDRITVATGRQPSRPFKKSEEMGLMSQMLKDFKGSFNDDFWEEFNYLPLDSTFKSSLTRAKNP